MEILKQLVTAGLATALFLVAGCASRVSKPVSDELRDTELQYEGRWQVHRLKAPRKQIIGRERFTCHVDGFKFRVSVRKGVMAMNYDKKTYKTNVAHDGSFRMEIPTERSYRRTTGANENKSGITVILQGSLASDSLAGLYTTGTARLNNQGCEARTKFKKL